jgi:thioredoxin 1
VARRGAGGSESRQTPGIRWQACGDPPRHYVGHPMASDKVHVFNDLNFEQEVLQADQPVLVDFTASWCGPCRALAPIIDQVAETLDGKAKVGKVDIDEAPLTAGKFGVRGVPTVMVFKGGEQVAQHIGLTTKQKLLDLVGT